MERCGGNHLDLTRSIPDDLDMFVGTTVLPAVPDGRGWDTQPLPVVPVVVVSATRGPQPRTGHRAVARQPSPRRRSTRSRRPGPWVLAVVLAALIAGLVLVMAAQSVDGAQPTTTVSAVRSPELPVVAPTGAAPEVPSAPTTSPAAAPQQRAVPKRPATTRGPTAGPRNRVGSRRERHEQPDFFDWYGFARSFGGS